MSDKPEDTIEELISLRAQFALLAGMVDGVTQGREGSDTVRKGGIAELRQILHGMAEWKRLMGKRFSVVDK
jgi:hypothetical protein